MTKQRLRKCDCLYCSGKDTGLKGWLAYFDRHGVPKWIQKAELKLKKKFYQKNK